MKKILITTALCLIGVSSMMAQGRINFANAGGTAATATPIRINNGTADAPGAITMILGTASTAQFGIGPGSTQIRLFAGLTSSSLSPVLVGTANAEYVLNTTATLAGAQGSFAGNNVAGGLTLSGFDGSAPVFLQFTATSANGVYAGVSPIIQVSLATGTGLSTTVFSANPVAGT
jgi:hypothetical protein